MGRGGDAATVPAGPTVWHRLTSHPTVAPLHSTADFIVCDKIILKGINSKNGAKKSNKSENPLINENTLKRLYIKIRTVSEMRTHPEVRIPT